MRQFDRFMPAIGRDVILTMATRLLMLASSVVTSILTARLLAVSGRGEYFVYVTTAAALVQFGNLGLQSTNLFLLSQNRALLPGLLANSLWCSVGFAALLAAASQCYSLALGQPISLESWLSLAIAPTSLFVMLGSNLLIALERIRLFNLLQLLSGILLAVMLAGLCSIDSTVRMALAATCVSSLLVAVALGVGLMSLAKSSTMSWLRFDWQLFRRGLSYAGRAYAVCLLGFILLRANVFLLRCFSTADEIGFYSVAAQFADVLGIFPSCVAMILFPKLARGEQTGLTHIRQVLFAVGALLAFACCITACAIRPCVQWMFGDPFLPAVAVLRWMLPGVLLYGLTAIVSQYHAARGMPKVLIALWSGAVAVAAAVGAWLIPGWGGVGAAIAFSVASGTIFVLQLALAIQADRKLAGAMVAPPIVATFAARPHSRRSVAIVRH